LFHQAPVPSTQATASVSRGDIGVMGIRGVREIRG